MHRWLLLFLSIVAITWLEFIYYPGHTFLAGESQTLVVMMERLRAPGFLSRDSVATNPTLTYTIYDEVTLWLCRLTAHDFQWALTAQQAAFRFAGVLGIWLLSLSAGMERVSALAVTALISAGAVLPGVQLAVTDPEPTPLSFALLLCLLGFGLLAQRKPLLAGLAGGIALTYQPVIASVYWLTIICGLVFQRQLRPVLRPTVPSLLVFSLLLANAAQLQPGIGEIAPLGKISEDWMHLQLRFTPDVWVSTWGHWAIALYPALGLAAWVALRCIWIDLNLLSRWMLVTPLVAGLLSLLASTLGCEVLRWALVAEWQLPQMLSLFVVFALIVCAAAGFHLWRRSQRWQASLWFAPLLAVSILLRSPLPSAARQRESRSLQAIAQWAEHNTWGGSMFLFPDGGKSTAPGELRGRAIRAVYTDWTSRALMRTLPDFAAEWNRRWRDTSETYSPRGLPELLKLPVEYLVLREKDALPGMRPEIATPDFMVYDAHQLQAAYRPLHP